jgi:Uncharacterised nucleotidyltransferase
MSPVKTVSERFHRLLSQVGSELALKGRDPGLELAGRFGLRRFFERQATGDSDLADNTWLEHGAQLRKQARALSAALADAGVRHFFFKGIVLLGRFYRLDDRRLDDVDLMVEAEKRNTALAVLHAHGYADFGDPELWGPGSRRPGVTMFRVDPATGERDTEMPLVDVHWGLEPVTALLPTEGITLPPRVWAAVEIQQRLPVPPDEYHAALVLHHLVRHDLLHVRGLLDFALLWEALPREVGRKLTDLAGHLGVSQALGVIGRVLVDDLLLFPLRGVHLGARDRRGRAVLRRARLAEWLTWAARHAANPRRHVLVSRSLAWRRYLLADAPRPGRLLGELVRPPSEYLHWRWPEAHSTSQAWRYHFATALRS